jgi:antitoxin component of MazEF toxin-antitoxin module
MELQITIEQLKALLVITPKSELRYYLCGVLLEVKDDRAVLVSTDGNRMLIVRPDTRMEGNDVRDGRWIIPRDLLASVKVKKGGALFLSLDQFSGETAARARVLTLNSETGAPTIDAHFPDWRRVVPGNASGEWAHYDPQFIGDFGTIAEHLSGKRTSARVHHNGGTDGAPVELGVDNALGVVMPLCAEKLPYSRPDWTR